MSLHQSLDAVRAARGLPALPDPTRIQGFDEPGDAPSPQGEGLPPAIEHQADAADEFGIHDDPPAAAAPPRSPLFPVIPAPSSGKTALEVLAEQMQAAAAPALDLPGGALAQDITIARAIQRAQATLPHTKLALLDKLGEWKGRPVILTEEEYQEVVEVVLRAMRRELDADLTEVLGRKPRVRRRRAAGVKPATEAAPAAVEPVVAPPRRRRGSRPRGSLLNREG